MAYLFQALDLFRMSYMTWIGMSFLHRLPYGCIHSLNIALLLLWFRLHICLKLHIQCVLAKIHLFFLHICSDSVPLRLSLKTPSMNQFLVGLLRPLYCFWTNTVVPVHVDFSHFQMRNCYVPRYSGPGYLAKFRFLQSLLLAMLFVPFLRRCILLVHNLPSINSTPSQK